MTSVLDLIWLRRLPFRYVSPPACDNISSGSGSSGPIVVIEHPPRFRVTGLRVDNCVLRWDALPGACEGACSVAICYNIYRSALPAPAVPAGFAVLAGSTITNTGSTVVTGDLGLSPGTSVTGFPPGSVSGTQHITDDEAAQAQIDLTAAYLELEGRVGGATVAGNLGGQTLPPGIYKSTSSLAVSSGDLTLDAGGNADAVFIFQIASTLNLTPGRQIILAGGAQAANIFWQVGSSATLDTTSVFKGSILALTSITVNTGASVEGRLLARNGAVTLDSNVIISPASSSDSGVYEVVAECVQGTEFAVSDNACYRVSALTTEGESDLSDAVCVECGEPTPTPPVPPIPPDPPEPTPDTPVLLLAEGFPVSVNTLITWTQASEPNSNEIWRSQNGGAFALLAAISGALTQYDELDTIASTDVWCYKVRGVNGVINGAFSNEGCAVRDMIFLGAGAVSYPTWQIAFGDLQSDDITLVTSLDLSGLHSVIGGSFFLDSSFVLSSVDLSALLRVDQNLHFSGTALTSLSLPALAALAGNLFADNTSLVSVSIPLVVFTNLTTYAFDSSALDASSVEGILAIGVASGVVSATILLDGGTNASLASLSAQGQADYAALVAAGNTVTINP